MWQSNNPGGQGAPRPVTPDVPVFGLGAGFDGARHLGAYEYGHGSRLVHVMLRHLAGEWFWDITTYSNRPVGVLNSRDVDRRELRLEQRLNVLPGTHLPAPAESYTEDVDVAGTLHAVQFNSYVDVDIAMLHLDPLGVTLVVERSPGARGVLTLTAVDDLTAYV